MRCDVHLAPAAQPTTDRPGRLVRGRRASIVLPLLAAAELSRPKPAARLRAPRPPALLIRLASRRTAPPAEMRAACAGPRPAGDDGGGGCAG